VLPVAFHRWAVDVAHNAEKQMLTLDPAGVRWWVLWLGVQNELAAGAVFDQIVGSLYGVREVAYWDQATGGAVSKSCLQAYSGAFERSPSIDAAIISYADEIRFCVNDLRADAKGFTSSNLYQSFARRHPPISMADLLENHGFLRFDHKAKRTVHLHDDNSMSRMYDLRVGSADAPEVAIECVGAVDSNFTETWNVGPGKGPFTFSVKGDWTVTIKAGARVKVVRQRIEQLLQEL
jgi:hypothetical protein